MVYNSRITGINIYEIRIRRGGSQEILSGLASIARSHLAMIESGQKCANVVTLWRIAEAFGLRLSNLIRLVEERVVCVSPNMPT